MTIEMLARFLGWCLAINVALLIFWLLVFVLAHDLMYRFHSRLFRLSIGAFDAVHYGGLLTYKLLIIVLNIAPYLALHFAR